MVVVAEEEGLGWGFWGVFFGGGGKRGLLYEEIVPVLGEVKWEIVC